MTRTNIYSDGNGNQVIEELDAKGNVISSRVVPDGPMQIGGGGIHIGGERVVGGDDD